MNDKLFAICLGEAKEELLIRSLSDYLRLDPRVIRGVRVLGFDEPARWTRDVAGLHVQIPELLRTRSA